MIEVRSLLVGPLQENCYLVRAEGSSEAIMVDPGDEAPRLLAAIDEWGVRLSAILLTHTHFDHLGAVAPVARASGAEVWVPTLERQVLADVSSYVPFPDFGPFESYEAEHDLSGGETLALAGLDIEVLFTPGHSPGHLSFSVPAEAALFSGDVLFQGSVGRTDLPGGNWPTLRASIQELIDRLPPETAVYPGHMGETTLGAERASNPFLAEPAR